MSYAIKLLPDEPLVMVTLYEDFSLKGEFEALSQAVRDVLDAAPMPHYLIMDVVAPSLTFEDFITAANYVVQGDDPIIKHAHIRQVILVAQSKNLELIVKAMRAASFGSITIKLCATMAEALAYARA
ncbi:MAG: hypothetical protein JXA10_02625 [Anaerolineae bacterium]|nr:hypothetical protein [Anaerolineae bacterium]